VPESIEALVPVGATPGLLPASIHPKRAACSSPP
jgi:hypothetical protein